MDNATENWTLDDVEGVYSPSEGQTSNELYDEIVEQIKGADDYSDEIKLESNAPDNIEDGWEVSVSTYTPRGSETPAAVIIGVLPSLEVVQAGTADFVADTVRAALTSKLIDPIRRAINKGESTPTLPQTLTAFVTRRGSGGFSAKYAPVFNAFASNFGKFIRGKTPYSLSKSEIFSAMTNQAFAQFHYPQLEEQDFFAKLMRAAITRIDDGDAVMHKGVAVSSDWFVTQLTERENATYEPEESVNVDEDFSFDL